MGSIKLVLRQNSATSMILQHEKFPIKVDRPLEKGGGGEGLMGGEYMLAGVGGCFCSTLFATALARDIEIEGMRVDIVGTLSTESPKHIESVQLNVFHEKCSDPENFEKLLRIAEKGCISINTIKKGISLSVLKVGKD